MRRRQLKISPVRVDRAAQHAWLGERLRLYGMNAITTEEFWRQLDHQGLGRAEIDRWCDEDKAAGVDHE
jgi:hypothetical protein